jgi:hypothetical protein
MKPKRMVRVHNVWLRSGEVKQSENLLALPRGVEVTPTGLKITGRLSYDQWAEMMKGLQRAHRSMLWVLGDGFVYGEARFGEAFSQAIEDYSQESARNAMWVSARVEPVRRITVLSWSHHQQVASLPADEQSKFLQAAVEKKLSVSELRAAVRLFRTPEPKKIDWQEPADPPEVIASNDGEGEEYEEFGEQIFSPSSQRSILESDFKHLFALCRALLVAQRGDLSRGIKPSEDDAIRLWTALTFS